MPSPTAVGLSPAADTARHRAMALRTEATGVGGVNQAAVFCLLMIGSCLWGRWAVY